MPNMTNHESAGETPASETSESSEIRAFVSPRSEEADRVVAALRERAATPGATQSDRLAQQVVRMLSKR